MKIWGETNTRIEDELEFEDEDDLVSEKPGAHRGEARVKIVKKIVLGVFSEVRKYLSRSFIPGERGRSQAARLGPILNSDS